MLGVGRSRLFGIWRRDHEWSASSAGGDMGRVVEDEGTDARSSSSNSNTIINTSFL
jgi:hypothetical protein